MTPPQSPNKHRAMHIVAGTTTTTTTTKIPNRTLPYIAQSHFIPQTFTLTHNTSYTPILRTQIIHNTRKHIRVTVALTHMHSRDLVKPRGIEIDLGLAYPRNKGELFVSRLECREFEMPRFVFTTIKFSTDGLSTIEIEPGQHVDK